MPCCHISLGGNTGNVASTFDAAIARLGRTEGCSVNAISRYFETSPVGARAGGRFLNAVAELEVTLAPLALLDVLQSVEHELGRVRTEHWGPRPIDLDVLFFGSQIIDLPQLAVPHPAAWYRRFVLDPLVEIAPDLVHPLKNTTIRNLRARLLARPLTVAFAGGARQAKDELIVDCAKRFRQAAFFDWDTAGHNRAEPTLVFWLGEHDAPREPSEQSFERLPLAARINASSVSEPPGDFVRGVVQSALA